MKLAAATIAASVAICIASPAAAGEAFAGAFQHGVFVHIAAPTSEDGLDLQLGWRSGPWRRLGQPRVQLMVSKNLDGQTSFAAAGLLWRRDLSQRLYGQVGLGLAVHDGAVHRRDADDKHRIVLGSRVLFEPEVALGWRLSKRAALEATFVHVSNAQLWTKVNPGMDDAGVRLVWSLGG